MFGDLLREVTKSRNFDAMRTPLPDFLSVAQAAEVLHITPRAVQHRIKAGKLPAEKFGNGGTAPYMIPRAAIERALAEDAA